MKAVLFDMDGVLVDTEKYYRDYWRKAAEDLGYDLPLEDILRLRSCDHTLAAELFRDRFGDESVYPAVQKRRRELMRDFFTDHAPEPKPGILPLIRPVPLFSADPVGSGCKKGKALSRRLPKSLPAAGPGPL